jgi:transglutaminase-like putative cysteine protease
MESTLMIRRPFIRLITWIDDELNVSRLLTLVLLLTALISVALGLASVVRALDLGLLLLLTILGVLVGWRLAVSSWPAWLAGSLALVTGIVVIMIRVGRLGEGIMSALWLLLVLAWQIARWPQDGSPDSVPLQLVLVELWAGSGTLLSRLFDWLLGLVAGDPIFDPVAVVLVWGLALWVVAVWAGWTVRRHDQPLWGLLPAGVLLVVSMAYGVGNFAFLLLLLGSTWLLLALVSYARRERRWQAAGIDFSLDIRLEMSVTAIWLSAVLVTLAALAPSVSIQQMALWTQRLIWGQPLAANPIARSLGLQAEPDQSAAFDKVRVGGLPRRHLLGSGPELSEQVVMIVHPGAGHFENATRLTIEPPHYWRSLTYDRYTGQGWLTGKTQTIAYDAGEYVPSQPPELLESPGFSAIQQQIQVVGDVGGLLHAAGAFVTVDQPFQVAWRTSSDAFGATVEATSYQVASTVPVVEEAKLRLAGNRYPEWIQNRYLALPKNVPTRVLSLARDLTAIEPTPYDRARAVESYLRTFPYDLNLSTPPAGRDVVDYFLFDLQRGYCDYYATAMVVLARAAGIPARLAIGYAGGEYDPAESRYLVTEADAHAWVEIYFTGYGWIEFEPTAARPLLERPTEVVLPDLSGTEIAPSEFAVGETGWSQGWGWGLAVGIVTLTLGGVAWAVADVWWLRHLAPVDTVERLYHRLHGQGSRLAVPALAGETPYEFNTSLATRLDDQTRTGRWAAILAPAIPEAQALTDLYVAAAYSTHQLDRIDQSRAIRTWLRLRWRLWLAYLDSLIRFSMQRSLKKIAPIILRRRNT